MEIVNIGREHEHEHFNRQGIGVDICRRMRWMLMVWRK
jgi:hypothetical protein